MKDSFVYRSVYCVNDEDATNESQTQYQLRYGERMTDDKPKRRPGGRSARVRDAVLDATVTIIQNDGIDAVTVLAVAERSGVHDTSIYRRWGSLDNLTIDALLAHSRTRIPAPDTGDIRTDLIEFATEIVHYLASPLGVALLRTMVTAAADAEIEAARDFWLSRYQSAMALVERGIARRELVADTDPMIVVEMVVAPLHSRALVGLMPLTSDLPRRLVTAALDGVSARSTPS